MSSTELSLNEIIEINPPQQPATQPTPEPPRLAYLCRHVFVDGRQCGSRALRGQTFCYYHRIHRTPVLCHHRKRPPHAGFDLTRLDGLDNHAAIQLSIAEVLGRIALQSIDHKAAWLLLYGLQIAGQNLRHAHPQSREFASAIIEDEVHGQLAEPEPGRPLPPSLVDRMTAFLKDNPNADLDSPEVQTQLLQNETLDPKDGGYPLEGSR